MSRLQLALIVVAALVLLALYVQGKWQERRLLQRMRATLHGGVEDALLRAGSAAGPAAGPAAAPGGDAAAGAHPPEPQAGARTEPRWEDAAAGPVGGHGGAAAYAAVAGQVPVEVRAAQLTQELSARTGGGGRIEPEEVVSEPLRLPAAANPPDWAEDPMLDLALELRCARAVDGVAVIDAAAALTAESFPLPVHFVVWDSRHEQWVLPDRFGYYTDALAAIQLAGRRGALTAEVLTRFLAAVRSVATALQADFDVPDPERLLAQARELDAVCARYDLRIGLTVFAAAPWTAPQLRAAAQRAGFVPGATSPGWVYADESGAPLLALTAESATPRKVVLELDVPLVSSYADGLAALIDRAEALAEILGGRVVDDNGRPVDAASMASVQPQLAQVHEEMARAGIDPGGVRARRLYR